MSPSPDNFLIFELETCEIWCILGAIFSNVERSGEGLCSHLQNSFWFLRSKMVRLGAFRVLFLQFSTV